MGDAFDNVEAVKLQGDGKIVVAGWSGSNFALARYMGGDPVQLASVVSRKTHGSAGTFDILLPLTGSPGIECRTGGANGDHTLDFSFVKTLRSVGSASVTAGTGSVSSSAIGSDAHQYIVNLTGVTNTQVVTVGPNECERCVRQ